MKKVLICIICVILCIGLFLYIKNNKEFTIEQITGVNFEDIAYVKGRNDENIEVDQFIKKFKESGFKHTNKSIGSTANMYYICYDNNDNILYTLVDVGNQNLFFIKKGSFNINENNKNALYEQIEN